MAEERGKTRAKMVEDLIQWAFKAHDAANRKRKR